jgi:hypothetical protein
MITYRWNHNHPPKEPSNFEVFNDGKLVHSGTFSEGMSLAADLQTNNLKERMARALEIIDERVACADTRNKLKGLLYADTR